MKHLNNTMLTFKISTNSSDERDEIILPASMIPPQAVVDPS